MAAQFGIIGLGTMGRNLALNLADHGIALAVWNLETDWTERFVAEHRGFTGVKTLAELAQSIERPRRIMMMIPAGKPVDQTIDAIAPHLEPGDILIDGGNSWFKDTQARAQRLAPSGIHFVGSGVSGGEDGARYGASLMPGGTAQAYAAIRDVFEAMAARSDSGPCVTHVGPDGAGHFVKMVHNGIEYGLMQLIAEAYELLRRRAGMSAAQLAELFHEWNRGPLESFLIEITAKIFRVPDPDGGGALVDKVLDKAGQKGTGKWTAQVALDIGVPVPTISAAIEARFLSALKSERTHAAERIGAKVSPGAPPEGFVSDVHDALFAAMVCCYAQGLALIQAGSHEWKWNIDLREIARIWKAGCIIRARFLDAIMRAYENEPELANLLLVAAVPDAALRRVTAHGLSSGLALPAMGASLAYFDGYRTASLPQNLIQAQRDLFGAHTYQRNDRGPDAPFVHSDWDVS